MNYMPEVLKMLDIKQGEEFKVSTDDGYEACSISCNGNLVDNRGCVCIDGLKDILHGKRTIEKLPWKPKDGELYKCCFSDAAVGTTVWESLYIDYYRFNTGNCFKPDLETTLSLEIREKISEELKEKYGQSISRN